MGNLSSRRCLSLLCFSYEKSCDNCLVGVVKHPCTTTTVRSSLILLVVVLAVLLVTGFAVVTLHFAALAKDLIAVLLVVVLFVRSRSYICAFLSIAYGLRHILGAVFPPPLRCKPLSGLVVQCEQG